MNVTARLSAFAVAPVEAPRALQTARLSLFDWSACASAGAREPVARIVRDLVLKEGGAGEASVPGSPTRVPARAAALASGAASHALDYDDTHFGHIGHPSVAVVPAALAIAERENLPGRAFLEAVLVGAELSVRVGLWLGRAHYQAGFHQTATSGALGAAAAAGRLLGLGADDMAQALGLVSTRAAGLKSQFGTMGKPYHAGLAASAGVEAALLAKAGFVSCPEGLEAPQGFGATHAGEAQQTALECLGEEWIFEGVSYKYHACCHGTHAALEALGSLNIPPETVESVEIVTHPRWLSVCDIAEPRTGLEAKFSYRLTAAMALAGRDTARLETFSDPACADPALVRLRDLVRVATDAALPETAARVEVRAGGATLEAEHDLAGPVSLDVRRDKLRAKAGALLGHERADRVWTALACDEPNLAVLTEILRGALE